MTTKINHNKSVVGIFLIIGVFCLQMAVSAFFINTPKANAIANPLPFTDGFESNNFSLWTSADSAWSINSGSSSHTGSKRAKVSGNHSDNSLSKSASTSGYQNIVLSYWYKVESNLESNDHLIVEWSTDGAAWNQLADYTSLASGSWISATHPLPAGADNASGFSFRFRATFDAGNDALNFDDVSLTGDQIPTGSIAGQKFSDVNGNGLKDAGEPGLADWEIKISGTANATTITDANGNYSFSTLANGNYTVCETPEAPWKETYPSTGASCANGTIGYSVTTTGEAVTGRDFGNTQYGHLIVNKITNPGNDSTQFSITLSGNGYINGSAAGALTTSAPVDYTVTVGTYSVSETSVSGWAMTTNDCVSVTISAGATVNCSITNTKLGSIIISKTTVPADASGEFTFTISGNDTTSTQTLESAGSLVFGNLLPGNYSLSEDVPAGWDLTSSSCGSSYELSAGENKTCYFTDTKRSSVTVTKIADPTTGPFVFTLAGVSNPDTATYADGAFGDDEDSYTFENLLPGSGYSLSESLPDGWSGSATSNCTLNGNSVDPADFELPAGSSVSCTFNNTEYGSITGAKFNDQNNNGLNDNEVAIEGLVITLTDSENISTTTETDSNGVYLFQNLLPGTYKICEASVSGWEESYPASGEDCEGGLKGYSLELSAGANLTGNDFGNYQPGKIIIYKWRDGNADGKWQKGNPDSPVTTTAGTEPAISGWTLAIGKIGQNKEGHDGPIPIEMVSLSLSGTNGAVTLPITKPGNYRAFEATRPNWQAKNPAPRTDSFFDIFCDLPGCEDVTFDKNSYFNVSVKSLSGQEITVDENDKPLEFGNTYYIENLGLKIAPQSGDGESTQSATILETKTLELPVEGGTSTVTILDGTVISATDGTTTLDLGSLSLASIATGTLSGLGTGAILDGSLQWGIANLGLTFSQPISLKIFVGADLSGQVLNIVHSNSTSSGWTSDGIDPLTCTVTDGYCSFTATKASYYAVDHTPPAPTPAPETPAPAPVQNDSGSGISSGGSNSGGAGSSSGGSSGNSSSGDNSSSGGNNSGSNTDNSANLYTQLETARTQLEGMLAEIQSASGGSSFATNPSGELALNNPAVGGSAENPAPAENNEGSLTANLPATPEANTGFLGSLLDTLGLTTTWGLTLASILALVIAIGLWFSFWR